MGGDVAENKTKQTEKSVTAFLAGIKDPETQKDCRQLVKLIGTITKAKPKMWGSSMVGFGNHHYRYASGREGDIFVIGFAPRKTSLVLYQMGGLDKKSELLKKLGKYKLGGGCLYIRRLEDIHLPTLKKLLLQSVKRSKTANP
jgi:hypothetical protein